MPDYGSRVPTPDYGSGVAASSFATLLGFSSCAAGAFKYPLRLEPLAGEEDISSNSSKPHLTKQAEVGIGVAVPFAVIMLLSFAYFLRRNFRKNKKPVTTKKPTRKKISARSLQPYLQRKGELEAEQNQKYELDAQQRRYELDGTSNAIQEIATGTSEHGVLAPTTRHELRGEEHPKEFRAP